MIIYICLGWIGMQLNAPVWYYVMLGIGVLINAIAFGQKLGTHKE